MKRSISADGEKMATTIQKKLYSAPHVIEHGTVEQITGNIFLASAMGISGHYNPPPPPLPDSPRHW
jgi:hypothetical protein